MLTTMIHGTQPLAHALRHRHTHTNHKHFSDFAEYIFAVLYINFVSESDYIYLKPFAAPNNLTFDKESVKTLNEIDSSLLRG